jgi:excisionase family DNA binding protein
MREEKFLTVKETAEILRISPKTIYKKVNNKKDPFPIKHFKICGRIRFFIEDILSYAKSEASCNGNPC